MADRTSPGWDALPAPARRGAGSCSAGRLPRIPVPKVDRLLESVSALLVDDGKLMRHRMARAHIDEEEILTVARQAHGREGIDQVKYAVLEKDGGITIVPRRPGQTDRRGHAQQHAGYGAMATGVRVHHARCGLWVGGGGERVLAMSSAATGQRLVVRRHVDLGRTRSMICMPV